MTGHEMQIDSAEGKAPEAVELDSYGVELGCKLMKIRDRNKLSYHKFGAPHLDRLYGCGSGHTPHKPLKDKPKVKKKAKPKKLIVK